MFEDKYVYEDGPDLLTNKRKRRLLVPIADLRAKDEQSKNYMELHNYNVWVANFKD